METDEVMYKEIKYHSERSTIKITYPSLTYNESKVLDSRPWRHGRRSKCVNRADFGTKRVEGLAVEDEIESSTEANIHTEESDKVDMILPFIPHLSSISKEA